MLYFHVRFIYDNGNISRIFEMDKEQLDSFRADVSIVDIEILGAVYYV